MHVEKKHLGVKYRCDECEYESGPKECLKVHKESKLQDQGALQRLCGLLLRPFIRSSTSILDDFDEILAFIFSS